MVGPQEEFSSQVNPELLEGIRDIARNVKGGAMKDHRGGDKLYHLAHC